MIFSTGTDLVNAVVLLSAIVMLPPNFYSLHAIANGKKIEFCIFLENIFVFFKNYLPIYNFFATVRDY